MSFETARNESRKAVDQFARRFEAMLEKQIETLETSIRNSPSVSRVENEIVSRDTLMFVVRALRELRGEP
jgi:DNA-binding ferritin-like protein